MEKERERGGGCRRRFEREGGSGGASRWGCGGFVPSLLPPRPPSHASLCAAAKTGRGDVTYTTCFYFLRLAPLPFSHVSLLSFALSGPSLHRGLICTPPQNVIYHLLFVVWGGVFLPPQLLDQNFEGEQSRSDQLLAGGAVVPLVPCPAAHVAPF